MKLTLAALIISLGLIPACASLETKAKTPDQEARQLLKHPNKAGSFFGLQPDDECVILKGLPGALGVIINRNNGNRELILYQDTDNNETYDLKELYDLKKLIEEQEEREKLEYEEKYKDYKPRKNRYGNYLG